jgi:hypothetical protein
MKVVSRGTRPVRTDQLMGKSLLSALLWLSCSIFDLNAHTLQDPGTVASDPGITGKMATGYCLPYAIALGDMLLQRSGIYSQGITVALDSPVTHKCLGTHIFVSYLDRQGQRWVVDNNRLHPTQVFSSDQRSWAVAVLHWSAITVANIHILFITLLPASNPEDKSRFTRWLDWYHTPDYQKTVLRERQERQQLMRDKTRISRMAFVPEGQADSSQARSALKVWTFVGVHIGRFCPKRGWRTQPRVSTS